jgi:hypothetical protein
VGTAVVDAAEPPKAAAAAEAAAPGARSDAAGEKEEAGTDVVEPPMDEGTSAKEEPAADAVESPKAEAAAEQVGEKDGDEMQAVDPRITEAVFDVLGVTKSVKSRMSYGGTAPSNVKTQAKRWLKQLAKDKQG